MHEVISDLKRKVQEDAEKPLSLTIETIVEGEETKTF
jgi:hypothetical protein